MFRLICITLLVSTSAFAAGKGGGISSLAYPALNFVLLFGFIIYKARKPLSEMFSTKANEVEELYQFAEKKSQEAEARLDQFNEKMTKVGTETTKILEEAKVDADRFAVEQEVETKEALERIKRNTASKLESERKNMLHQLNATLLEEVISKTKANIKQDNAAHTKATDKLVSQIR